MPIFTVGQRLGTLHRYFLSASYARKLHDLHVRGLMEDREMLNFYALASWWYSALWVVIDGWPQVGIEDSEMDGLRGHPLFRKLKDFRDATMHYRPDYEDRKLMNFLRDPDSVDWVRDAHETVSRVLLREMRALE